MFCLHILSWVWFWSLSKKTSYVGVYSQTICAVPNNICSNKLVDLQCIWYSVIIFIIDKNINIIIFSLTVLGKTNREINVAITNQSILWYLLLSLWEIRNQKSIMKINAVEIMYVELCYNISISGYKTQRVILKLQRYKT